MANPGRRRLFVTGTGICLLLIIVAPFLLRGYWVRLLTNMFMFAVLAESVNIIAGYCGYLALGNMLFFGLGAYIEAVLMVRYGWNFFPALTIACLGPGLFAVVIGLPMLRLKGHYFIMGTIALLELLREITSRLPLTGGGQGIMLPIFPGDAATANLFFYYFMLCSMLISIACTFYISRSYLGYAFRAIKLDEEAASVMGINPIPYKTAAWAISALFTGLTGGGYAYWLSYIDPGDVFHIAPSIKIALMMVLGGGGTVLGPIAGAFFIELLSELVWGKFLELHLLILGLILVLVVIFAPKGFMEMFREGFSVNRLLERVKESNL